MSVLSWVAASILLFTAVGLLLTRDWRVSLGLLGVQYLGVFWLSSQHWPFSMAAVKLVSGWMCIVVLGMTHLSLGEVPVAVEEFWTQGRLFRIFAACVIVLIVLASAPRLEDVIPGIGLPVVYGGLFLTGLGILHLGIISQPFRVILGLLTVLAGFETLYAALESSILVAAMLAVVDLGLALVGAYLLVASKGETLS
ncbi:MAG: hypothetical protein Fur0043_15210 [Anaerolineales bacterium]